MLLLETSRQLAGDVLAWQCSPKLNLTWDLYDVQMHLTDITHGATRKSRRDMLLRNMLAYHR